MMISILLLMAICVLSKVAALSTVSRPIHHATCSNANVVNRRTVMGWFSAVSTSSAILLPLQQDNAHAAGADTMLDTLDVESYMKSGFVQNPMGVSGQAGMLVA